MKDYNGEYNDKLEELEFNRVIGGKVGRFAVKFQVANYGDVCAARLGLLAAKKIRRMTISGTVDPGAGQLVLPLSVVKRLGLPVVGKMDVIYADRRHGTVDVAEGAYVEILRRQAPFNALIEPNRKNALIGALVLEALDLLVDCRKQKLLPRDPRIMHAAME